MKDNPSALINPDWNPLFAWLKGLPLALGIPSGIWIVLNFAFIEPDRNFVEIIFGILLILMFAVPIHLIAFAVVGIPVFFIGQTHRFHWIWSMKAGWFFAAACGILPCLVAAGMIWQGALFESWKSMLTWSLIFGIYGVITGFASWLNRPGKLKQSTVASIPT